MGRLLLHGHNVQCVVFDKASSHESVKRILLGQRNCSPKERYKQSWWTRIFQPAIYRDFLSVDHRSEGLGMVRGSPLPCSKENSRTNPIPGPDYICRPVVLRFEWRTRLGVGPSGIQWPWQPIWQVGCHVRQPLCAFQETSSGSVSVPWCLVGLTLLNTWRIIPVSKWLPTMVISKFPK